MRIRKKTKSARLKFGKQIFEILSAQFIFAY